MDKNYFAITDTGKVRENNEDTFIAEKTADQALIIACVIDGVGGYSGGEIASSIARKSILHYLKTASGDIPATMRKAVIEADQEILIEKSKNKAYEQMACVLTLAVVDLTKNQFSYAHVGDTRLYLLRDGTLVKISKDQSFVGFLEDSGRLSEEQAMRHPKRNEINKALGFGAGLTEQEDYMDFGQSPFLPGDLLLVCSDGLSDMVNKQDITEILTAKGSLKEKAETLINAANGNGGLDNITLVLVENTNQAIVHEVAKPAYKPKERNSTYKPEVTAPIPHVESRQPEPARRKSNKVGIITILFFICILFIASTIYLVYKDYFNPPPAPIGVVKPPRNPQEKKFQDTLDELKGNILVLSDSLFDSPILITEPLKINRDTLYLIAEKEIVFMSDSSFKGIPLILNLKNKYVLLQNITFQDFDTAISVQNNVLVLKNVKFGKGETAIKKVVNLPSSNFINLSMQPNSFKTDTVPLPVNK